MVPPAHAASLVTVHNADIAALFNRMAHGQVGHGDGVVGEREFLGGDVLAENTAHRSSAAKNRCSHPAASAGSTAARRGRRDTKCR